MSDYTKKDAAKETESGGKETSRAWHQAREDAQTSDDPKDQELAKDWSRTPDSQRSGEKK
jgi:hypothetical protein